MDALINGLPKNLTNDKQLFVVIDNSYNDEGNVCTTAQVAAAKAKGWTPYYHYGTMGDEYKGSDDHHITKGDVNGDNQVSGTDLVALSNIVLGRKEKSESADVNGDGSVNGTDIVALSNIILGRSSNAPRRAGSAETELSIEPFDIQAGETKEMLIDLTNPNNEVTLVQFDLQLPEGLTVKKSGADLVFDMADRTSWRKHTLDANETDGCYRFLLYSSSNTVIEGTEGAIIKVTLVATQDMKGKTVALDNILLVSPDEQERNQRHPYRHHRQQCRCSHLQPARPAARCSAEGYQHHRWQEGRDEVSEAPSMLEGFRTYTTSSIAQGSSEATL